MFEGVFLGTLFLHLIHTHTISSPHRILIAPILYRYVVHDIMLKCHNFLVLCLVIPEKVVSLYRERYKLLTQ